MSLSPNNLGYSVLYRYVDVFLELLEIWDATCKRLHEDLRKGGWHGPSVGASPLLGDPLQRHSFCFLRLAMPIMN